MSTKHLLLVPALGAVLLLLSPYKSLYLRYAWNTTYTLHTI
jgi:hypothetical protein